MVALPRLTRWADNALKQIRPRMMDLPGRVARAWTRNPNFDEGQHSKKRWDIERQLAADVATWERRRHYVVFNHVPGLVRFRAQGVLGPLRRVLAAGDWWKPRADVDETTGLVATRVWLPESTWSAAGLVRWGIAKMESFYGQAVTRGRTTTPHSKPDRASTPPDRQQRAFTDETERFAFFDLVRELSLPPPRLTVVR